MAKTVNYKSYCWSVGNTSYRTKNFNVNIERQLDLLDKFRNLPQNIGKSWIANNEFQAEYYDFLKQNNFVEGDAQRPDKDAREKTSGLVDIGLLDDDRNLTEVGKSLLEIARKADFESDNLLEIPKDSFIYFKQLLKTCIDVNGKAVRPFVVFLYLITELEFLTYEEFTYLMPLCIDRQTTFLIAEKIKESRKTGSLDFEEIIMSVLMQMDNYKVALKLLKKETVNEEIICKVGINRKSPNYDKPYFKIYKILNRIVFKQDNLALELYDAIKLLTNSKVAGAWRKALFNTKTRTKILKEGNFVLKDVPILKSKNLSDFKEEFFKMMHLYKAEATLSDYFDLNRRYFKATDSVLFEDAKVKLDILPMCYISGIGKELLEIAFKETKLLAKNVAIEKIDKAFEINAEQLYEKLGKKLGKTVKDRENARKIVKDERYERFNKLIDERFSGDSLIRLITCFENREDDEIRLKITDNADIPTMFEYVLGIAWYIISDRQGDVLEYMNLSLEADLLPKTHAGGGEADIVWKYSQTEAYPKHTLLIEATLAEGTNQRRMEMEPVSRHLGEYLLKNRNEEAYCVFITTFLNNNVISDFRARRFMEYYSTNGEDYITGMKILPLQTLELKTFLKFDIKYPTIYKKLDEAYKTEGSPKDWYEKNMGEMIWLYEGQDIRKRRFWND